MTFVRTSELFGRVGQVSSIGLDHASVINKSAEDKNAALSTAAAHYYKKNTTITKQVVLIIAKLHCGSTA